MFGVDVYNVNLIVVLFVIASYAMVICGVVYIMLGIAFILGAYAERIFFFLFPHLIECKSDLQKLYAGSSRQMFFGLLVLAIIRLVVVGGINTTFDFVLFLRAIIGLILLYFVVLRIYVVLRECDAQKRKAIIDIVFPTFFIYLRYASFVFLLYILYSKNFIITVELIVIYIIDSAWIFFSGYFVKVWSYIFGYIFPEVSAIIKTPTTDAGTKIQHVVTTRGRDNFGKALAPVYFTDQNNKIPVLATIINCNSEFYPCNSIRRHFFEVFYLNKQVQEDININIKEKNHTFLYASLLTITKEFLFKSGNVPGNDSDLIVDEGFVYNESGKFFKSLDVGRPEVGEKTYTTVVVISEDQVKPQILKFVVLPSVDEWTTTLAGCVNNAEDFLEMGTLLISLGSNITFASDGRSLIVTQTTLNDLCTNRRINFFQERRILLNSAALDLKTSTLLDENRINFLKLTHEKVLTQYSKVALYRLPVSIQRFLREKFSLGEIFQDVSSNPSI